ncbi:hypothetical protein [Herpetosiphon sp. NSE202]|uniref:hypothetical protein n=1 Tax=Herpetosiphon sp. NSE202 TaxID=3351349 RepID=UPI00363994AE
MRSRIGYGVLGFVIFVLGGITTQQTTAQSANNPVGPSTLYAGTFTYQGELVSSGTAINNVCDFQFSLYSVASGGSQLGSTQTALNVNVQKGRFSVELDAGVSGPFGEAFTGGDRWLSIAVRCPAGTGSYTALNPRQKITATPYALSLKPGAVVRSAEPFNSIFTASNLGTSGNGLAGYGTTSGVYGEGTSQSNETYGVYGTTGSSSTSASAVYGRNNGAGIGVHGMSTGYDGVAGESTNILGNGVRGVANNGPAAYGVWGLSTNGRGVVGNTTSGIGVSGESVSSIGVSGRSTSGSGVYGFSNDALGVSGASSNWVGVQGIGADTGVRGFSTDNSGVWGQSENGSGILGVSGGNYASVWGFTSSHNTAVQGQQIESGTGNGVEGIAVSGNGIVGISQSGYAGMFYGSVNVTGAINAAVKNFRIDHPLDPANQYLQHASVESDAMKTIYDGVAVLDRDGKAVVKLPDWFEALNGDFRYQLTALNAPGPGLYIAAEIKQNQFTIAGGSAGSKVSWQVTGIRHDPYAVANPLQVEVTKPLTEQGTYLAPQGSAQAAKGVDARYRSTIKNPPSIPTIDIPAAPAQELEQELQRKLERR